MITPINNIVRNPESFDLTHTTSVCVWGTGKRKIHTLTKALRSAPHSSFDTILNDKSRGVLSVNSTIISVRWCSVGQYHTKSDDLTNDKLSNKALSTLEPSSPYNPAWITGFVDGEGSFGVQCIKSSSNRLG